MTKLKRFGKYDNKRVIFASFLTLIGAVLLLLTFVTNITSSVKLDNDVEVTPNTDLTYYLEVTYKGVDRFGVESTTEVQSSVVSDYIVVEDKIPEGLTFNGFVTTEDKSIGSVSQNGNQTCMGYVVDDTDGTESLDSFHGLHYNEETRMVTFKVKNLQAGCKLVVGVKTITPETIDDPSTSEVETRRDFYNTIYAREHEQVKKSNTVHVFMGDEYADTYSVSYEYIGDVPENAPPLPTLTSYGSGVQVGVAHSVYLDGYTFSGWSTTDATVTSGTFKMPEQNVKFVGSFKKIDSYKVTYSIEGELPPNYIPPSEKEYYPDEIVILDSLKEGDTFNGYTFLGWKTLDVELNNEGDFVMPSKDVSFVGNFEEIKYKVTYKFYEGILPNNYESLLPEVKEYKAGETVTLENIEDVDGYHFLGWYKEDAFEMPAEDIVIYGEWKERRGLFRPTITKEIQVKEDYYKVGDIIHYTITITNNQDYAIKNVVVEEKNPRAKFIITSGITAKTDTIIEIATIGAKQSVVLEAAYTVTGEDSGIVTNTVEILGALADNNYDLDTSQEYKASTLFKTQRKVTICNIVDMKATGKTFQYHISNENDYDLWLSVSTGNCKAIYVPSGEYKIVEVVPQDYTVESIIVTPNEASQVNYSEVNFVVLDSGDSNVTFHNRYKSKGYIHSGGEVMNDIPKRTLYDRIKREAYNRANGAMKLSTNTIDDKEVYYYTSGMNNHVLFANKCWQVVRTTETEGVKLIYNGVPRNGQCNNTGTNSQIGISAFIEVPKFETDLSYAGYMYNDYEKYVSTNLIGYKGNFVYGKSVSYSGGKYTLVTQKSYSLSGISSLSNIDYPYTCLSTDKTCQTVYYIYKTGSSHLYMISLNNGELVEDAMIKMLGKDIGENDKYNTSKKNSVYYINKKNSNVKTVIDNWYKNNMTSYTKYLEDTVWCNERGILNENGMNSNIKSTSINFGYMVTSKANLVCSRKIDKFTVSENNGNGDLIYPVGLITTDEGALAGKSIVDGNKFWTMSPSYLFGTGHTLSLDGTVGGETNGGMRSGMITETGSASSSLVEGTTGTEKLAVRPAISLRPNITYIAGDGSVEHPYVVPTD